MSRGGDAPPGYHGGAIFHNREKKLEPGAYRYYDVHPHVPGTDRGPERLIIDQVTGMAFYTSDHYVSFEAVGE
jgi:ribonuclease T1